MAYDRLNENSGILIIDKPVGLTSADVTNRIKRIEGVTKTGHTGTLDPFASGVLICTINKATRLSRFFLHGEKKYTGIMILGVETDTQDATGQILKTTPCHYLSENTIYKVFKRFEGEIHQIPPVFSALKHNGVPLYKYARKGMPVTKPARQVSVSYLNINHVKLPEIVFEVCCSSGTYIRTLCADIGKELGCGGHLKSLRRIENSGFGVHEAIPLSDIESIRSIDMLKNRIISMSDALKGIKPYIVDIEMIEKIKHGKLLTFKDIVTDPGTEKEEYLKLIDTDHHLLAVVRRAEDGDRYNYCCVFINP